MRSLLIVAVLFALGAGGVEGIDPDVWEDSDSSPGLVEQGGASPEVDKAQEAAAAKVRNDAAERSNQEWLRRRRRRRSSSSSRDGGDKPSAEVKEVKKSTIEIIKPGEPVEVFSKSIGGGDGLGRIKFLAPGGVKKVSRAGNMLRVVTKGGFVYGESLGREFEIVKKFWDRNSRIMDVTVRLEPKTAAKN